MNLSDACVIIERQARWDGVGILELLQTCNKLGIDAYPYQSARIQSAHMDNEFRQAYNIFMSAGREMFAPQAVSC